MRWESKRPEEVRTYRHDWSAFLGSATIADAAVTVDGVTNDFDTHDASSVTVTLSGGTAGTVATVIMTITSSAGDDETQAFTIAIVDVEPPVSLADAKDHLRIVDDDSQDEEISRLLAAATRRVEAFTGHLLSRRAVVDRFETFGVALELSRQPAASVTSIDYADENGDAQVLADYLPALGRTPPRIYPERDGWWPSLDPFGEVVVTYTAGFAEGELPDDLAEAVLRLTAAWFQNREAGGKAMPDDVRDLCQNYRRVLA